MDVVARTPTPRQYELLIRLGSGNAWLSATKRECEPLLRRGWVTADFDGRYYQWVRITPGGFAALALAAGRYGLPEMRTGHQQTKVCSECAREWRPRCRCGSRQYRFETQEVARVV